MAMEQASATLRAKADTSPDGIKRLLDTFAGEFGVTKEQIEKRIQRRIESIQPAQVVGLKRIYVSLRDEMSTQSEWFEPVKVLPAANGAQGEGDAGAAAQAPTAADKAKAMLRERARPPAAPAPASASEGDRQGTAVTQAPVTAPAPERPMAPPPARRGFDADAFAEQMQRAADKGDADTLDALGEQLRDVVDEDLRATLTDMHKRLREGLEQPCQPEAPQRPLVGTASVPSARRRTTP